MKRTLEKENKKVSLSAKLLAGFLVAVLVFGTVAGLIVYLI